MGVCFVCDSKLFGERTRVCTSITPHSNVPYPEKIAELMGEEFVIIVTPSDQVCKHCTTLFTHMDKLEHDLRIVKNSMVAHIQKKYGILPPNEPIKTIDIVNGHIKTDELEICRKKVPSGLNIRSGTMNPPMKMSKPQPTNNASKLKIYKCGFCSFQSNELGHVRFHMRSHMNKKEEIESINQVNPTTMKTLAPQRQDGPQQKKRLFRCQVCTLSFDNRGSCLEHIQKIHNNKSTTTLEKKKTEEIPLKMSQGFLPEMIKTENNQQAQTNIYADHSQQAQANMYVSQSQQAQTNIMYVDQSQQAQTNMYIDQSQQAQTNMYADQSQQAQTSIYVDQSQQGNNSIADSFNMLFDNNGPSEGTTAQQERTQNTVQEMLSIQGAALHVNQLIPNNINGVNIEMGCEENKTDDLDLESMLAAIHSDI